MSQPADSPPGEPVVDEAERAFERGDWKEARRIAGAELNSSDEPGRGAARAMLDRFRPDAALGLMYLASLLFLVLTLWLTRH